MAFKLIIQAEGDVAETEVLDAVKAVIAEGRISVGPRGKQYCFITSFPGGLVVEAKKNERSGRFLVRGRTDGRHHQS